MAKNNCDDCFYRGSVTGKGPHYCRYLIMTNEKRPCPPGDGCTVKVPRAVKRRVKRG